MQAFSELRQAARECRVKLIDKAKSEYEDALRQIANLERDLLGREKPSHKSIAFVRGKRHPRGWAIHPWGHTAQLGSPRPAPTLAEAERRSRNPTAAPAVYVRAGAQTDSHPFAAANGRQARGERIGELAMARNMTSWSALRRQTQMICRSASPRIAAIPNANR